VIHDRSSSTQQKPSEKTLSKYERRKAANRLEEIEKQIQGLETKQKTISDELANPPADSHQVLQLGEDYVSLQGQIESLMEEWSELHEKLAE
jgi:predicted  nucleic acid-binding Zn-ribbon protein